MCEWHDASSATHAADDRLGNAAANLMSHGLHVNIPIDEPLSPCDPDHCIGVYDPASGQYAEVGYVSSGRDSGEVFLQPTYRTAPDKDPDGTHMADGDACSACYLLPLMPDRGLLPLMITDMSSAP